MITYLILKKLRVERNINFYSLGAAIPCIWILIFTFVLFCIIQPRICFRSLCSFMNVYFFYHRAFNHLINNFFKCFVNTNSFLSWCFYKKHGVLASKFFTLFGRNNSSLFIIDLIAYKHHHNFIIVWKIFFYFLQPKFLYIIKWCLFCDIIHQYYCMRPPVIIWRYCPISFSSSSIPYCRFYTFSINLKNFAFIFHTYCWCHLSTKNIVNESYHDRWFSNIWVPYSFYLYQIVIFYVWLTLLHKLLKCCFFRWVILINHIHLFVLLLFNSFYFNYL